MKITLASMLALSLCANLAYAESGIKASNRQINLGIGGQHIDYVEEDNYGATSTGVLDSEKGTLPSFRIEYVLQGDGLGINDLYGSMSYNYAKGKTHYDGYLQNLYTGALTPYQTDSHSTTSDFELKFGKGFGFGTSRVVQLTPYVAYSYHQWKRDSAKGLYGYLEDYEHGAASIGLLSQLAIAQNFVISVDASTGKTSHANMQVENDLVFHLQSRRTHSLGLGMDYAMANKWHLFGKYHYTQFRYGESDVVSGFIEPSSKTKLTQLYLGAGYGF